MNGDIWADEEAAQEQLLGKRGCCGVGGQRA